MHPRGVRIACCAADRPAGPPGYSPRMAGAHGHNLFFAILPDAAAGRAIAATVRRLRNADAIRGRWLDPARHHLTLRFLGTHAAPPAELVRCALAAAARVRVAGFRFTLDVVGTFEGRHPPAWIGCSALPEGLRGLHDALEAQLAREGIDGAVRPAFVPHVTIVRDATCALRATVATPIEWCVDGFVLIDSGPPEPYRVIGHWPLLP